MKKNISDEKYIQSTGCFCPSCLETNIEQSSAIVHLSGATREVLCKSCNIKWVEFFEGDDARDSCTCGGHLEYNNLQSSSKLCTEDVLCECGVFWENEYNLVGYNFQVKSETFFYFASLVDDSHSLEPTTRAYWEDRGDFLVKLSTSYQDNTLDIFSHCGKHLMGHLFPDAESHLKFIESNKQG